MKSFVTLLIFSCFLSYYATAQTWQWGLRGGSPTDPWSGVNESNRERVYDMATDRNGNVYILTPVVAFAATLGHASLPTYNVSAYTPTNLMLASYSCNGALRWHKMIGGNNLCIPKSLRVDSTGHVYVLGQTSPVTNSNNYLSTHFDADTTLPYNYNKSIFLVQYDTAGQFKWLRMPQADTVTGNPFLSTVYDMALDASGNVNIVAWLRAGSLPGTGFTITSHGLYILRYNSQGTVIGASHPPGFNFLPYTGPNPSLAGYPEVAFQSFRMQHAPSGAWIIAGMQDHYSNMNGFSINGSQVGHDVFVACFNSQWQHLWHYVADTNDYVRMTARPVVDAAGNVFLTGCAWNGVTLFGETVQTAALGDAPFVAKLNSAGTRQWLSYASDNAMAAGGCNGGVIGEGITLTSGGEAAITGGTGGLKWGSRRIPSACNTGYGTFVARFNAVTGEITGLDTVKRATYGPSSLGTAIAAGKAGSLYIGGTTSTTQYAGQDTLETAGGLSDFFLTRFGYACNCTALPAPAFTRSVAAKTVTLSYSATASGIDSVRWSFGDGQYAVRTGSGIPAAVSHSYTANGTYTVCATAYGPCGSNTVCQSVQIGGMGLAAVAGTDIRIFPNPARNFITVEGAPNSMARITDMTGRTLWKGSIRARKETISLAELAAGVYSLTLVDAEGQSSSRTFVKE